MKRKLATKHTTNRKVFDQLTKADYDELIDDDCVLVNERDEPVVIYRKVNWPYADIIGALNRLEYATTNRGSKMKPLGSDDPNVARIFGFMPRRPGRADFCHAASMSRDFPNEHRIFTEQAARLSEWFRKTNPKRFEKHMEQLRRVKDRWVIPGSVFTSGICNKNNALPYHYDTGNFKGAWSSMLGFSRGMEGGNLVFPEYRLAFSTEGARAFLFDGQGELHGVEYFRPKSPSAYRYTVVYYALKLMCNCLEPKDELERIRGLKTAREKVRAQSGHKPR
jgi:hypothetical protein